MNVPTIAMDPDQAKAKLKAYRRELHHQADATYQAAADGYRFLSAGFPLIDIEAAIRAGGFDGEGLPCLAIARADSKVVCVHTWSGETRFYRERNRGRRPTNEVVSLPIAAPQNHWRKYTRVPMVPADVIQQLRNQNRSAKLSNYHVLWEVERWYDRNPVEPPVDPYLLKHCGGGLFAVLAEWDLTELERSVMRGQIRR